MPNHSPSPSHDPTAGLAAATATSATTAPGARLALVLLLLINLFNYIDRYVLAAVLPLVTKEFFKPGDPDASSKMGLLATAFLVAYMLAAPIFGWLADRTSRWTLVGIGVIVWSLASGGSGLATTYTVLLLMRIIIGIGEAAYGPSAPTLISDMYPVSKRGSVLAWFYVAIPVGSALGYLLGGEIVKHFSWHWAFLVTLPPGLILGAWCLFMKEPPRGQADAATSHRHAKLADYLILLKTPSYVLCTLGMTALTFAIGGISFWMPTYIYERMHGSATVDTTLLSSITRNFGLITVVAGLSATLLGGYIADALRARIKGAYFIVSGSAMLLGFPCFVAMLYVPVSMPWLFWLLLFLAIFFLFLNTGPANTILANVTHPSIRASAFAVNIFVIHAFGDAISPWIIGLLRDATHRWDIPFLTVGFLMLACAALWLWGARYLDEDTKSAPGRVAQA